MDCRTAAANMERLHWQAREGCLWATPLPGVTVITASVAHAVGLLSTEAHSLRRQQQSQAARALAAMAGVADVGRSEQGFPLWPQGQVGSLAHTASHAVAAVALQKQWQGLGVDVEPDAPLPEDAARLVLTAEERAALAGLSAEQAGKMALRIFCAKECVHKALNPLNGAWLEFDEVAVQWQGDALLSAACYQPVPRSAAAHQAMQGLLFSGRWWALQEHCYALLGVAARSTNSAERG